VPKIELRVQCRENAICKSVLAHKAKQNKTASGIGVGRCCIIACKCSDVSQIRSSTGHVLVN
jgi:hypothetical protein